jgi:hypothetical protein
MFAAFAPFADLRCGADASVIDLVPSSHAPDFYLTAFDASHSSLRFTIIPSDTTHPLFGAKKTN